MNPSDSKTKELHRLALDLGDKNELRRPHKHIFYPILLTLIYNQYMHEEILHQESLQIDNFKISDPKFNREFYLLCSSYCFVGADDQFEFVIKNISHHQILKALTSSRLQIFFKIGVLKNSDLQLYQKETPTHVFSCEFFYGKPPGDISEHWKPNIKIKTEYFLALLLQIRHRSYPEPATKYYAG